MKDQFKPVPFWYWNHSNSSLLLFQFQCW